MPNPKKIAETNTATIRSLIEKGLPVRPITKVIFDRITLSMIPITKTKD
jgi:hypothetical protein